MSAKIISPADRMAIINVMVEGLAASNPDAAARLLQDFDAQAKAELKRATKMGHFGPKAA